MSQFWSRPELSRSQQERRYKARAVVMVVIGLAILVGIPLRWFYDTTPLPFTKVVPFAFAFSAVHAAARMGRRRFAVFAVICLVVCTGMEVCSTLTSFPFGEYTYNPVRVGMKFGTIPWTVPLAWFAMMYPSLLIANLLVEGRPKVGAVGPFRIVTIALVGSAVITVWDLALDPHMVNYESAWIWRYSDECRQQQCMRGSAESRCLQRCKDGCTREESWIACRRREHKAPGGWVRGECKIGVRAGTYLLDCAQQCRVASPLEDLEEGCATLVAGADEMLARPDHSTEPGVDYRAISRKRNWKLDCEVECCAGDCESACEEAHPILSGDDDWWRSVGGHPSASAAWLADTFPWYFHRGWFHCIPFSNYIGWLFTSLLAFLIYGVAKTKWVVGWEKNAALRGGTDKPAALSWDQAVPDHLTILSDDEGPERWRAYKARMRDRARQFSLMKALNVQKLITGSGVVIYFGVAWCNILFVQPSGLALIALFGMGLPVIAALFRLFNSEGESEIVARMYAELDRRQPMLEKGYGSQRPSPDSTTDEGGDHTDQGDPGAA